MFIESFFISLGKRLCFIFLPSFQWQNRSWQRNRRERQRRNLNHLLNHHFHSSFFSANLEICNEGGIQLLQHILPEKQKQRATKRPWDCGPEQLSSSPSGTHTGEAWGSRCTEATPPLWLGLLWRSKPWGGGKEKTAAVGAVGQPQVSQGPSCPGSQAAPPPLRERRRHEPKHGHAVQIAREFMYWHTCTGNYTAALN